MAQRIGRYLTNQFAQLLFFLSRQIWLGHVIPIPLHHGRPKKNSYDTSDAGHLKYDEVSLKQESSSRHHLNSKTTFKFKQYQMIQTLYLIDSNITLHNKLRYHKKSCTELLLRGKWRFETRLFWSYWAIASKHHGVKRDGDGHMQLWWRGPAVRRNWRKSGELKIYEHELRAMAKRYLSLKFCWTSSLSFYISISSISYYDIFCAVTWGVFFKSSCDISLNSQEYLAMP